MLHLQKRHDAVLFLFKPSPLNYNYDRGTPALDQEAADAEFEAARIKLAQLYANAWNAKFLPNETWMFASLQYRFEMDQDSGQWVLAE